MFYACHAQNYRLGERMGGDVDRASDPGSSVQHGDPSSQLQGVHLVPHVVLAQVSTVVANPAHHGAAGNTHCIQHSERLSNEVVDVAEAAVVYSPASATGDLCAVRLAP
jgi:hypothetical protein